MNDFINKLKEEHCNDEDHISAIFSENSKLIIEAPAGYGKTKTMVSRIAYIIASNKLGHPKKILALTFSINAAYKIRKDVAEKLPKLLQNVTAYSPIALNNKIITSNYHGFCRRILRLYGNLLHSNLKIIDQLRSIDDSNNQDLIDIGFDNESASILSDFSEAIKRIDRDYIKKNFYLYINQSFELLEKNHISYNSIIAYAIYLFIKNPEILEFYQNLFSHIIVDEFQDTNLLSWGFLSKLIGDNKNRTNVFFMGDSLQRIYGFIGAIPNLINKSIKKFDMKKVTFRTNYRFKDNPYLLTLDNNLRKIAENPYNPSITKPIDIRVYQAYSQDEEAYGIIHIIEEIKRKDKDSKITILFRQRNNNTQRIVDILNEEKIDFFYALYSDDDQHYINFHKVCEKIFIEQILKKDRKINRKMIKKLLTTIKNDLGKSYINDSLIVLLETFLKKLFEEYKFLGIDEKIEFIKDTFESRTLRQFLGYVDSKLIITTVHGAKGLEWDYIILPDMEQYSFPNFMGLCGICLFRSSCLINWNSRNSDFETSFYDELSVFYVACTRARKSVYFTYSTNRIQSNGQEVATNLSCLLKLSHMNTIIEPVTL